ncbi:hypothetical protein G6F56_012470 [Rhizopus delemar]|nr:hypothetical protein G6F56_012470 [Rhizopus delemar]
MSTQTYLLCDLCNTFHARDVQQLNRHKRRDCEGSSTLTSRFYESDDEVDYFAPSDYVGGQLSDSDNSGDVADAVNLGPIIYNYSGPRCLNELETLGMEMLKISDENGVPRAFQRELTNTLNSFLIKHLDPETVES